MRILALAAVLTAMPAAVGATPAAPPAPPRLLSHAVEPPHVVRLSARDDGRMVRAHVGDVVELRLAANASTGYRWRFTSAGVPVLRLLSQRYVPPKPHPGLVGVPGKFVATLGVRSVGTRTVRLEYVRHTTPPSKPAWRFSFRVAASR